VKFTPLHESASASDYVLRESKAAGPFWHHGRGGSRLSATHACRVELAGDRLISPAYVELMDDAEVRGHSGGFRLVVDDQG